VTRRFNSRVLCRRVLNHCTGSVTHATGQYLSDIDDLEREARVGRKRQRSGQRRVFSFGPAVRPQDRRLGNRRILAPPVSPESATRVPPREADRSRLSLTTTAGRRCLTDTFRERSTMSAIERCANPVPREAFRVNRRDVATLRRRNSWHFIAETQRPAALTDSSTNGSSIEATSRKGNWFSLAPGRPGGAHWD